MSLLQIVAFTPADLWIALKAMTLLEIVAVVFTLANVWLMVKENIWGWPAGIISVLLYLVVFWRSHLYMNAGLQIVYFVLSIHGWYEWLHGGENKTERRIKLASSKMWAVLMSAGVVLTVGFFWLLRATSHDASLPVWDALTTAFSIVGQYMLNTKLVENWLIWAIVDVIYVFMFIDQKLYLTALLYAFFVVLCLKGLIDWRRIAHASA
ncbi:MAG: nicotinamide mononucleotide transporter [Thermoanaerobaculia bacterium]|jgi:nicotinamide mononucleotide transporter|nr:nicotinamide mononucleotide transporter [Thermoanaerobaculia bacterium]